MSDVSYALSMLNTLRVRRAERRWSQRTLAKAAGIGFDRYFRIEREYTEPTSEECDAIASALGIERAVAFPSQERVAC